MDVIFELNLSASGWLPSLNFCRSVSAYQISIVDAFFYSKIDFDAMVFEEEGGQALSADPHVRVEEVRFPKFRFSFPVGLPYFPPHQINVFRDTGVSKIW